MTIASIYKLKKYYGDRLILDIDKFEIEENEKIGLVGDNGSGKTTLIKLLTKAIEPDDGSVYLTSSYSYISQNEDVENICESSKVKSLLNAPDEYNKHLSGGEKVKIRIANALKDKKKLIIADEPTSNLDIESIKILEDMLKKHEGALLLVSHDRKFLDSMCNTIVAIEDSKIKVYNGNYSKYSELKKEEKKRKEFEYEHYENEKKRLENAIIQKSQRRDSIKRTPKRMGNSEARLHKMGGQKGKKKIDENIKAIKTRIEKLDIKEKPKKPYMIDIKIKEGMEVISKNLVEVKKLTLKTNDKILLKDVSFKIKRGKKIALIGKNGCGKTMLLKEIIKNNRDSIKINNKVKIGYFDQSQNILNHSKTILDNIKEDSYFDETYIRINLNLFGFKDDNVYKKVENLSGGERVKVALCKIILEDNNLIVLDEPTNYLDITAIEALEDALKHVEKTIVMVSHDKVFISNVCDYIIEIKDNNIIEFNGTYHEYEESKNEVKLRRKEIENKENIMVLENKLSYLISLLSIETDKNKKDKYEEEYTDLLRKIKKAKML
jgi:macrolide transport system ATP-binding/permease protein